MQGSRAASGLECGAAALRHFSLSPLPKIHVGPAVSNGAAINRCCAPASASTI